MYFLSPRCLGSLANALLPRWDGHEAHDPNDDGDWANWADNDDWTKTEETDWDQDGHEPPDAAAPVEAADPAEAEWQEEEEDMKTEVFLATVWKIDIRHDAMKISMGVSDAMIFPWYCKNTPAGIIMI